MEINSIDGKHRLNASNAVHTYQNGHLNDFFF